MFHYAIENAAMYTTDHNRFVQKLGVSAQNRDFFKIYNRKRIISSYYKDVVIEYKKRQSGQNFQTKFP